MPSRWPDGAGCGGVLSGPVRWSCRVMVRGWSGVSEAGISERGLAGALPRHVAVVMDGNGRWAVRQGLPRAAGHRKGVDAVREIVRHGRRRGICYLTLFAFSSENWRRPRQEVRVLTDLLRASLEAEARLLVEGDIRLSVIGDLSRFPGSLRDSIERTCRQTRGHGSMTLTIALNYGGQWDIRNACRAIAGRVARGELAASGVTCREVRSHLCTHDLPDPDLFIRTGGEVRLSNFLLWQLAYTELFFTDTCWPDFDAGCFEAALGAYAARQRRFGSMGRPVRESA